MLAGIGFGIFITVIIAYVVYRNVWGDKGKKIGL